MDTLSRLIVAVLLCVLSQVAGAYGLVTGVQGTVATLPAKVFGQSSAGTYTCGSNCTGSYQASCESSLADNKATFSASFPSASYAGTTYQYLSTAPWTVRCSTVVTYTNNGTQTTTLSDQVKAYCPVNPNTGANQFSGGTSLSSSTCIDRNHATCPANATATDSTTCVCNLGYKGGAFGGVSQTSSCVAYTCPTADAGTYSSPYTYGGPLPGTTYSCQSDGSNPGCVVQKTSYAGTRDASGAGTAFSTGKYTGNPCQEGGTSDTSPTDSKPEPADATEPTQEEKCALGNGPPLCVATVNGAQVCVTCSASTTTSTETSTTPAGAGAAPTGLTAGTKSTETTCSGTSCTTTTTYKDSTGTTTGTTTSTGPKVTGTTGGGSGGGSETTLCDVYPNAPACKISSFSGSCAAGTSTVACDGDAVQCALAREQAKRNCEFFEKTGDETAAAIQAKTDGVAGSSDHPGRTSTDHAIGTFDQTDIVGGSCPPDRVLGSGTAQVTIPFSNLCGPAGVLGQILIGITALACLGIVFKGS